MSARFHRVVMAGTAFLVSCAGSARIVEPGTPIDMGKYSVRSPRGEGWEVVEHRGPGVVIFTRSKKAKGDTAGNTSIMVEKNGITRRGYLTAREQVAYGWFDEETRIMTAMGVQRGLYRLGDIRKGTAVVGGKNLYSMNYRQSSPVQSGRDAWILTAVAYVYFPADFEKSLEFYCLRIGELNFVNRPGTSIDFTQIEPVIESFTLN